MAETKKKQHLNIMTVRGILAEKDLEIKQTRTGKTYISGNIVVKTGENALHKFKVNTYELKKDGTVNGMYTGLVTSMNEHKSIASHGEEADAVEVKAQFDIEDYKGRDGNMVNFTSKVVNGITRISKEKLEPKADGTAHVFIEKTRMEVTRDGDETGRGVISGYVRKFNGEFIPVEFKIAIPEGVERFVNGDITRGELWELNFELVNQTIKRTTIKEMAFGKPKEEIFERTVNEIIIYSGVPEEEAHLIYSTEDFNKALVERELKLKEIENGTGSTGATPAQANKPKVVDDFVF